MQTKSMKHGAAAVLGAGIALAAFGADFPNLFKWNKDATGSYIDDVANWLGTDGNAATRLPGDGETQTFNMDGWTKDLVVRVKEGETFTQQAHFYVVGIPNNHSFTLDATGAHYVQAPAHYLSDWQGFGFFSSGTSHWCNFENVKTDASQPICSLDDGVITASVAANGVRTFELKSGTFNCYDPIAGGATSQCQFLFGSAGDTDVAIFGAGGHFRASQIVVRGGAIKFTGGAHEALSTVSIGNAYVRNPKIELSGGTLDLLSVVNVGAYNQQLSATLDVFGTGHLVQTNNHVCVGSTENAQHSHLIFRENGAGTLDNVSVGFQKGVVDASMTVMDDASVKIGNTLYVCNLAGSTGTVTVAGNATLDTKYVYVAGQNANECGTMTIGGNATWKPQGGVYVGCSWEDSVGLLEVQDDVRVESDAAFELKTGTHGTVRIAGNAQVDAPCATFGTGNTADGCTFELAGGTTRFHKIDGCGKAGGTETNVFLISGGDHALSRNGEANYVGFTIGYQNTQSRFEMTGGSLTMERIARVGYGNTGTGSAVVRMRGGDFYVTLETGGSSAVFNVCDSTESVAALELFGGTLHAGAIRGWTGAKSKGGTGWATLVADGGTLAATADSVAPSANRAVGGGNFLETFDEALLGAEGLYVDTSVKSTQIAQTFTDREEGVAGRVVKIGDNTLAVAKESAHGVTAVAGGTLVPASAAITQFGRTLVVTNSATFSLAGAPTTFTVERLVLGDETTRGTLDLDEGDVIVITGQNGLSVGRGFVRCNAAAQKGGTQVFFRLGAGASVDPDELAKLHVLNGSAEYRYTFETADDGEGGTVIQMKAESWPTTSSTWTGAESGAWNAAGNWEGDVPGETTTAVFPAAAENKSVTIAAGDVAHKLSFAADYAVAGAAPLAADVVSVDAGATSFAAPISPYGSFNAIVAENASLTLSGGVDSENGSLAFAKQGSGRLDLAAASPKWSGDWLFAGGTTRATQQGVFGPVDDPMALLEVDAATLAFTDAEQTYARAFTFSAGAGKGAVLDVETDATLGGSVTTTTGGLVKRGAGTLTLACAAGTHTLDADDMNGGSNKDPDTSDVVLPESGDGPDKSGLGGLSVLEGTLRLTGAGKNQTIYQQTYNMVIGSRYVAAANAEVEVSNCTFKQGSSGRHLIVGGCAVADTAVTAPTLRVVDGGCVEADTVRVGTKGHASGTMDVSPTLAITNGSVSCSYIARFGCSENVHVKTRLRMGEGATLKVAGSGGVQIGNDFDGEVADGAVMTASSYPIFLQNSATGELRALRGGRIVAQNFSSSTYAPSAFSFLFDGGIFECNANNKTSMVFKAALKPVTLGADGMEFVVPASKKHTLAMRLVGEGPFVKSGAGELVICPGKSIGSDNVIVEEDFKPASWTGLTTVKEGTLTLEADVATNVLAVAVKEGATLQLAGDQTLGALSGAGAIVGVGDAAVKLDCAVSVPFEETLEAPAFANVALGAVTVDFDLPAGESYKAGTKFTLARLGEGATATLANWKVRGLDDGHRAVLAQEGDAVVATIRSNGTALIVR